VVICCERKASPGAYPVRVPLCPGLHLEVHYHISCRGFTLLTEHAAAEEWLGKALASLAFEELALWFDLRTVPLGGHRYFMIRAERLPRFIREFRAFLQGYISP
jgi:hypothetical protein